MSIGNPAGIGKGTGFGLRERDRDGIGLGHYQLRASYTWCLFFYLGPFLGDWIKHFDCLEKRASVVSSASVDFPVEGGHA